MSDRKATRALITGASSGIGESIAKRLAQKGYDLFLVARREDRLQNLKKSLSNEYKVNIEILPLDLSLSGAAEKLFNASTQSGKSIQLLVNNAGIGPYGDFLSSNIEKHLETLRLNNQVLTDLCYRFSNQMITQKEECYILNVSSVASFQGTKKFAVYAASKSYVRIFSEILGAELSDTNVFVSCLCPGGTYTEFLEKNGQDLQESGKHFMMSSQAVAEYGLNALFAKQRVSIPGMLNQLICFLPRLLPRGVALKMASKSMQGAILEKN